MQGVLESAQFQRAIIALIVLNAITLGLETSSRVMATVGPLLLLLDRLILGVFVAELLAKLVVYRLRFHKDPWNLFDLGIVTIALLPTTGGLAVLRALRILRVLRLVSAVPSMPWVVGALGRRARNRLDPRAVVAGLLRIFGDGDQAVRG